MAFLQAEAQVVATQGQPDDAWTAIPETQFASGFGGGTSFLSQQWALVYVKARQRSSAAHVAEQTDRPVVAKSRRSEPRRSTLSS